MSKYEHIIHHEHPISLKHRPMSREARAAQFAPYAALVGHQDIIANDEHTFLEQEDPDHVIIIDEELN